VVIVGTWVMIKIKSFGVQVCNSEKFNPKNYKLNEYIRVNGTLYLIMENLKCNEDELMLIEVGTN